MACQAESSDEEEFSGNVSAKDGEDGSGADDGYASSDDDEFVYCACGLNDYEDRFMVECPRCKMWQHCNCLNIVDPFSPILRVYICHNCVAEEKHLIKVRRALICC
jgi:hypothetical protein